MTSLWLCWLLSKAGLLTLCRTVHKGPALAVVPHHFPPSSLVSVVAILLRPRPAASPLFLCQNASSGGGWRRFELDDADAAFSLCSDHIIRHGSPSRSLLPLLQEQAVPEVAVQPWCARLQGALYFARRQSQEVLLGPARRSAFSTLAVSVPPSTTSRTASTWSPMSTSSFRPRRSRPLVSAPTST
jgi:hypothetical protein